MRMLLFKRSLSPTSRFLILLFVLGVMATHDGRGQAWVQSKGHAYLKLSHGQTTASEQYRFDGETIPYANNVEGDAFFDRSIYFYGEYGMSNDLSLILMVPYKSIRVLDAAFQYENEGLGSVMIGLRQNIKGWLGITADQHALAANFMVTLPTGYTRNYSPSIGPGQLDLQMMVHYGLSLWPLPGYAQAGVGYRYRSTFYGLSTTTACQEGRDINCIANTDLKYDDELLFSAEVGFNIDRWALVQFLGSGVWSNQSLDAANSFSIRNPIPTRQRYIKTGGGVSLYPIRNLGISIQVFFTPVGYNTLHSTDYFFGIEYQLR